MNVHFKTSIVQNAEAGWHTYLKPRKKKKLEAGATPEPSPDLESIVPKVDQSLRYRLGELFTLEDPQRTGSIDRDALEKLMKLLELDVEQLNVNGDLDVEDMIRESQFIVAVLRRMEPSTGGRKHNNNSKRPQDEELQNRVFKALRRRPTYVTGAEQVTLKMSGGYVGWQLTGADSAVNHRWLRTPDGDVPT